MSNARLTFTSALWNHAGKILEYLLMYVTSIAIARGLGVEENGRFVGLFSLSQLLLVLCSFGLETSLNKFIPQLSQEKGNEQATYILRRAILIRITTFVAIAVLFLAFIALVSIQFISQSRSAVLFVLTLTGVRSVFPLFATVLTAQLRTALTARINLAIRVIELIAVLALMHFAFTVTNLFVLFLITSALHVIAYATFSRMGFVGKSAPVEMKPIIMFGGIFWVNTNVDFFLGRQGDLLFLTNLLSDSSQGGLYDVAYSIAQLASLAMTIGLTGVTFATFARLAVSDQTIMDRFYAFSIRLISLLTIPLYAFLLFNAQSVLSVLYSSRYLPATILVQGILGFRILSRLFGGPENAEYLLSYGKVVAVVKFGIVAAATNIVLNIILIPQFGAMGAVIASGCGNLLANFLAVLTVMKWSGNRIQFFYWMKLTGISLVIAFVCSHIVPTDNLVGLILRGILYALFIGSSFALMKPFTAGDAEWLSRVDERFRWFVYRFAQPESPAIR